jgi:uncharacterized metal-binding protein YceD (DUF177 family)
MSPKKARQAETPWSVPVRIAEIPPEGRSYSLEADERTRAAAAVAIGIPALPRLRADLTLTRTGRDGLRVIGEVTAVVGQICVVTLEPMETNVAEAVDLLFTAEGERSPPIVMVDLSAGGEAPDPPEPLENGTVDLGRIAVEFLVLGIDPYPRKPDVSFEPLKSEPEEDASAHPFAALRALKKDL